MAKYCLKKPTKRLTCKRRYKIEKKVKSHAKKVKKAENKKAGGKKGKLQKQKLVSVPNKCPFKEEILIEAEIKREEIKEQKALKKAELKRTNIAAKKLAPKNLKLYKNTANEEFVATSDHYVVQNLDQKVFQNREGKSIKTFVGEVRATIENSDVIIEVLDARDPLGSRSGHLEKFVIETGKRLVLLLNKIDLVPKENAFKWLSYLRNEFPTIAFKASTQEQNKNLGCQHQSLNDAQFSSKCIGATLLMKLLGNYCRNKDIKTSIRVGIIGFPNVGKSSVINSLKRKKMCLTGATPGLTRQCQEIQLDQHVRLIDSPGVVLTSATDYRMDPSELALRNALRIESLQDPTLPVEAILRRCSVKVLMLHYNIPEFSDCDEFLSLLAKRTGRLKKGGLPNLNAAARNVLNDWNNGTLRYYTEPPENESKSAETSAPELVESFSKEFDLDALEGDIKIMIDSLPTDVMNVETKYDPSLAYSRADVERMETNDQESRTVVIGRPMEPENGNIKRSKLESSLQIPDSLEITGNVRIDSVIKKAVKKRKRLQHKLAKRTDKLANSLLEQTSLNNQDQDVQMTD